MTVLVALLRAVNLPSHKKVSMSDLRDLVTDLGLRNAVTLLQTGNIVFEGSGTPAALERKLEAAAAKELGLQTEFMVRTRRQWAAIVRGNPFPDEAKRDPSHLVVMVCKHAPGRSVRVTGGKREQVRVNGTEIYITYPDGIGRSRLKIDAVGTGRNWNTVLKIAAAMEG